MFIDELNIDDISEAIWNGIMQRTGGCSDT
jgi:hypothetical protein